MSYSVQLIFVVLFALSIRSYVGLWGHSGMNHPPMHGDYEAQRHWMEITTGLPIAQWYRQTPLNDLQYWGLDYPPLTAYVSWLFGKGAHIVVPDLVRLTSSRGYEGSDGKAYMRFSVLLTDMLFYIPVLLAALKLFNKTDVPHCEKEEVDGKRGRKQAMVPSRRSTVLNQPVHWKVLALTLLSPALILIDHGHFQYNNVSIGLAMAAAIALLQGHDLTAAVCFSLSLNFKQMSLYYAPVFFVALLMKCVRRTRWNDATVHFVKIGATTVGTFVLLWLPIGVDSVLQNAKEGASWRDKFQIFGDALGAVLLRLFPFNRGIFEDKVANLWFGLSVATDFRAYATTQQLSLASLGLTLLLLAPVCIDLVRRQTVLVVQHEAAAVGKKGKGKGKDKSMGGDKAKSSGGGGSSGKDTEGDQSKGKGRRVTVQQPASLLLALLNCSLSFFLASFQVHEKSLLLVLAPSSLMVLASYQSKQQAAKAVSATTSAGAEVTTDPDAAEADAAALAVNEANKNFLVIVKFNWYLQTLGAFSMFPLLVRDGQRIPYCALMLLFHAFNYWTIISTNAKVSAAGAVASAGNVPGRWNGSFCTLLSMDAPTAPPAQAASKADSSSSSSSSSSSRHVGAVSKRAGKGADGAGEKGKKQAPAAAALDPLGAISAEMQQRAAFEAAQKAKKRSDLNAMGSGLQTMYIVSCLVGMLALHCAEAFFPHPAPVRYPDLYPVLFALFSLAQLVVVHLYCVLWQVWMLPPPVVWAEAEAGEGEGKVPGGGDTGKNKKD